MMAVRLRPLPFRPAGAPPAPATLTCPERDRAHQWDSKRITKENTEKNSDFLLLFPFIPPQISHSVASLWASSSAGFGAIVLTPVVGVEVRGRLAASLVDEEVLELEPAVTPLRSPAHKILCWRFQCRQLLKRFSRVWVL